MESPPRQRQARKSPTGASYNDGFDAISPPDVRDERVESFDELIATVTGQTAFTILQFAMNPGNATTFPRLSRIAQLFEKYKFEQLEFYFQHDVSQFNAQGAAGLVLLSALYDAASAAPTSKTQIEATKPRVICMPNQNSLLRCSPQRMHPQGYPLYVRSGGLPGGSDVKTYDVGNMFLTVQGMAGAGEVGELHVRGRVRLYDELLDASSASSASNNQVSWFQDTATQTYTTTVAKIAPVATASANGLSAVNTAGSIVLPAGNYLVDGQVNGIGSGLATASLVSDLQKNGTTVFVAALPTGRSGDASDTNAPQINVSWSAFVTSNGTDAFTMVNTMTGANTLTAVSRIRFTAI